MALEMAMRAAMYQAGACVWGRLLRGAPLGPDEREVLLSLQSEGPLRGDARAARADRCGRGGVAARGIFVRIATTDICFRCTFHCFSLHAEASREGWRCAEWQRDHEGEHHRGPSLTQKF